METIQPAPDYWTMTNKELITICKKLSIQRWSGKRKKDLIAMIRAKELEAVPEEEPPRPASPEPYEFLDALLLEHANRVLASLPKSPITDDEVQECKAAQTTPATEAPIVRLPVGMAAISFADIDDNFFIEF